MISVDVCVWTFEGSGLFLLMCFFIFCLAAKEVGDFVDVHF